jgi:hypothetical protein
MRARTRIVVASEAMMSGAQSSWIAHAPGGANRETG